MRNLYERLWKLLEATKIQKSGVFSYVTHIVLVIASLAWYQV